ncbi:MULTISPECIES: N-acetylmuramoyl-L-alanine amidase [Nitrospirillum]|uniref:N-acetylmuramoyl-L-alanine amidase n=1 Tax=Nitrospirillum amazonense TaxID=28077 RepID=A0A560FZE6_9PROT|nr:N-acetylmuramoyl-L-alanine amidase [Nitrospirillum amazonense]MEC4591184.1 N-acetylmuramoyl-L-alanine amidase [Nitrospirillum amazonense]TWB27008.1 N-acetylmuramoyl-L-alanine amidase [Nitrospirillum amazonense]
MALRDRPSPNHGPRPEGTSVDILVLHYTGMLSAEAALDRLCDPAAEVSAHYVVEEDGTVWRLVGEGRRAWHAGRGAWGGAQDVNNRSIGVEIVNPGHEYGYRPFPQAQMQAVIELCRGILARQPIPAGNVIAHSDMAPARKQDPGELFDWPGLARAGIGLWPATDARGTAWDGGEAQVAALLARLGYDPAIASFTETLIAFQRHWHPEALGQPADAETVRRLHSLLAQSGR